jgi:hypothetical protein
MKLNPHSTKQLWKTDCGPQRNPASVLAELSENRQQFFRDTVDVAVKIQIGGQWRELKRRFFVRVDRLSKNIDAIC